ncbi:MAG TPA: oligosaccharide flippase family protein [Candidatus Saccharimonadales bacterium]|nr:oligosaccharide flippase family protein [Candidatus Saccharimonadales bacterium]
MGRIVRLVRSSTFLKHNAIFFFGALAAGALNYVFYPIMARLLPTGSFGEVQALFSLFAQINIFLSVLGLLTVNIVANRSAPKERDEVIIELEKLALLIGLALLVASVFAGGLLQRFFHFGSPWPFAGLALAALVSVPLMFRGAYLRGRQAFLLVSVLAIVAAGGDLVVSILFVLLGWGTTGVMAGLVAAQFAAFVCAAWTARRKGFSGSRRETLFKLPDMRLVAPELRYALVVLACSLTITGLYSVDTIVMKHWFDARTAGLYAGIATIARIIIFITGTIPQVLLPSVKLHQSLAHNRQVLLKSLVLLGAIGGTVLLVFSTMPRFVVGTLMGGSFLAYAGLLPRLGLMVFVISVINLFISYHLALRRYGVALVAASGVAVTAALLALEHQTPVAVVDDLLYGGAAMGLLLGVWSLRARSVETRVVPEESEA